MGQRDLGSLAIAQHGQEGSLDALAHVLLDDGHQRRKLEENLDAAQHRAEIRLAQLHVQCVHQLPDFCLGRHLPLHDTQYRELACSRQLVHLCQQIRHHPPLRHPLRVHFLQREQGVDHYARVLVCQTLLDDLLESHGFEPLFIDVLVLDSGSDSYLLDVRLIVFEPLRYALLDLASHVRGLEVGQDSERQPSDLEVIVFGVFH